MFLLEQLVGEPLSVPPADVDGEITSDFLERVLIDK